MSNDIEKQNTRLMAENSLLLGQLDWCRGEFRAVLKGSPKNKIVQEIAQTAISRLEEYKTLLDRRSQGEID